MATEAHYNKAKQEWLDAAKNARDLMEISKERYKEEKDMGSTSESWEKWVRQNDPMFTARYNEFKLKESAFIQVMKNFDSSKADTWEKAYSQLYKEKYYGDGEDKGSTCLIIVPEV